MAQPGLPGSQFPGEDAVMRRIKDLERAMQQLRAANQLGSAGIRAIEGGIVVEGSETVNGPLTINGPLTLQPGSIENDSLASPILIEAGAASATDIAITTTPAVVKAITFVVPAGFTRAIVSSTAAIMAVNPNASLDYVYVQSVIMGLNGGEIYDDADAGRTGSATIPHYRDFYGLVGGDEVTVGVSIRTGISDWAANAANQASIYAQVTFLR